MKKFLLFMLAALLIFVVIPSPVLGVVFGVSFLVAMNGWFALLFILLIPAVALSWIILFKLLELDFWDELFY